MLAEAITRVDVASYVSAVFTVYIIIVFAYVLTQMLFSFGARPPYYRWSDALLSFLRDVSEPYLGVFRKLIPAIGAVDLSPMLALIVLYVAQSILYSVISGT